MIANQFPSGYQLALAILIEAVYHCFNQKSPIKAFKILAHARQYIVNHDS